MAGYFRSLILVTSMAATVAADPTQPAITGTVYDPSARPIRGARVECGSQTAVTGLDGRFTFPGAERCRAVITASGFEVREVEIAAPGDFRVDMTVAGVVERIIVSATRYETTTEEAGVAATVLTRSDLERRAFPTVPDLLRETPGLQVTTTGRQGALTSVFTRGGQRTGTMILIDGVPVNDPGGEYNLAHLSSSDIDRIEVVRGPESALFGAEASAGVVQLFTRRGDPENKMPRGSLSYERGSFQTDRWVASLLGGSGARLDYALNAEQFHTAGEFSNDYYRDTTGSANVGFRFSSNTQLRTVFRTSDSVLGVPGQVGYWLVDQDAHETNRDSTLSLRLDDARGSSYLQRFTFGYHRVRDLYVDERLDGPYALAALVLDVRVPEPRTYLVRLLDPNHLPDVPPAGTRLVSQEVTLFPFEPFLSATSRSRAGYQGTWEQPGGPMVFGYDYERQEGDVSARAVERNNHGLFLHKQQTLAGRVFLSGGLRMEHSSAFGRKVTPRGAASFLLAGEHGPLSSTLFRVSAGRGITEPSLIQNFAREFFFAGNPDLRPEKTSSYEAGLVQEWFSRRARTEVAVFHNSFQDLITFVSLPPPVWGSWDNVDRSRARGVEFSGRVKATNDIMFGGSYMRLWSRIIHSNSPNHPFTGIGQELGRRPEHSGSVSMSIAPSRWWFQAGAILVGERQDYDYNLGVTRNPGYQNVYAACSVRLNRHLSPYLRADNLLNSRYEEVLGYSSLSRGIRGGLRFEW